MCNGPARVVAELVKAEVPLLRLARIRRNTERMKDFLKKHDRQPRIGEIIVIPPETKIINKGRGYIGAMNGRVDSIRHVAAARNLN